MYRIILCQNLIFFLQQEIPLWFSILCYFGFILHSYSIETQIRNDRYHTVHSSIVDVRIGTVPTYSVNMFTVPRHVMYGTYYLQLITSHAAAFSRCTVPVPSYPYNRSKFTKQVPYLYTYWYQIFGHNIDIDKY